jgi:hypothetical protein
MLGGQGRKGGNSMGASWESWEGFVKYREGSLEVSDGEMGES